MNDKCHCQRILSEVMKTGKSVHDIFYASFSMKCEGGFEAREWIVQGIETCLVQKKGMTAE
jgi:hypothetical protein